MFKNFTIALILSLLQLIALGNSHKIEFLANHKDETKDVVTGIFTGNGTATFDTPSQRFALKRMFRYRHQDDRNKENWNNIPLRMVMKHKELNIIEFKELNIDVLTLEDKKDLVTTGALFGASGRNWTLRISVPEYLSKTMTSENQTQYLEKVKLEENKWFTLSEWVGLEGMVESNVLEKTRADKPVLTTKFEIRKPCQVWGEGSDDPVDAYHISSPKGDGQLFSKNVNLSEMYKTDALVRYTLTGDPTGNERDKKDFAFRLVTGQGENANFVLIQKSMVKILCEDGKSFDARLFSTDSKEQKEIVLEVECKGSPTQEEVLATIIKDTKYFIQPIDRGLKKKAEYKAGQLEPFNGDDFTAKLSVRISFERE